MGANDQQRGVSISARLPQEEEPGPVTVQLTGRDLRLIATGQGPEGKSLLKALQSVVGDLQAGIDHLRRQEGAKGDGSERPGYTQIMLGSSAIPDPEKLG